MSGLINDMRDLESVYEQKNVIKSKIPLINVIFYTNWTKQINTFVPLIY